MLIKLTNAAEPFVGKDLLINSIQVLSVFEADIGDKRVTVIYGASKDSWQVQESLDDVLEAFKML
jgi:hypothetical protein